jgi:hypothetical protein
MTRARPWLAVTLALLLMLGAAPGRAMPVAVVTPQGACLLREAPDGALPALVAALAEESARLEATAQRLLADAAAMRLAPARERVPAFGDWAYDWVQSYVTAYRVLLMAAKGLVVSVAEGGAESLTDRITEAMASPVRDAFRDRVLDPALPPAVVAADLRHAGAVVEEAWRAALAAAAARAEAWPPARGAVAAEVLDLGAAGRPFDAELAALVPPDPVALIVEEGADAGMVFMRSMRPMAARLGAVAVRVSEAGSIVATGGAFGYALAGVPGVAVGAAGGIGLSWGIDWLFNRVDAAFNRRAFEAQALAAIDRAEQRLAMQGAQAIAGLLAARGAAMRGAAMRPGQRGCP